MELKVAELARAKDQCDYLQAEYDKSADKYDTHDDQSAFEYTMDVGALLQKARDDMGTLEKEVAQAQRELDAQDDEIASKPSVISYAHIPFRRIAQYVCIGTATMLSITILLRVFLST